MTPANDNRPQWFDQILIQYEPFLRKRCIAMMPDSAEETYQEATCRALESWHKFRPDGSFTMWLNYIVRTIHHESRMRQGREKDAPAPQLIQEPTQEAQTEARQIIGLLSPQRAEMVVMLGAGHSFVEVAAVQGVSPQAVAERAKRFWKSMRTGNDNAPRKAA